MAGASSVHEDGTLLSRLDRGLLRLETLLAVIAGLAVFSLMLLAVASVGARNAIGTGLPGYVDWIEQIMPVIAFLAISYTMRGGGHIRMDIVIGRFSGRAGWAMEWLTTFLTLILVVLLIWGTWSHFGRSFDWNAPMWSRDSSMDIALPIWPAKLVVPIAFAVLAVRLALQLWGYSRALMENPERPVAVPITLDAAQQAMAEAQTVSGASDDRT